MAKACSHLETSQLHSIPFPPSKVLVTNVENWKCDAPNRSIGVYGKDQDICYEQAQLLRSAIPQTNSKIVNCSTTHTLNYSE